MQYIYQRYEKQSGDGGATTPRQAPAARAEAEAAGGEL
jgi:hypothetical protein